MTDFDITLAQVAAAWPDVARVPTGILRAFFLAGRTGAMETVVHNFQSHAKPTRYVVDLSAVKDVGATIARDSELRKQANGTPRIESAAPKNPYDRDL